MKHSTKGVFVGRSEQVWEEAMKRNVSNQCKEEYEPVLRALAEEEAWDIAVQIWNGKTRSGTSDSKVLSMKKEG